MVASGNIHDEVNDLFPMMRGKRPHECTYSHISLDKTQHIIISLFKPKQVHNKIQKPKRKINFTQHIFQFWFQTVDIGLLSVSFACNIGYDITCHFIGQDLTLKVDKWTTATLCVLQDSDALIRQDL